MPFLESPINDPTTEWACGLGGLGENLLRLGAGERLRLGAGERLRLGAGERLRLGAGERLRLVVLLDLLSMSSGFGLPLLRVDLPPEAVARRGGRMPVSGLGLALAVFVDLAGEAGSLFDGLLKHSSDLVLRRPRGEDGRAAASSDAEVIRSA